MQTPLMHRVVHVFPTDHPTSAGHFPGNPVIPGACLLREVLAAIRDASGFRCCGITSVKFLHPVRPGDAMAIEWAADSTDMVRFSCLLEGSTQKLVTGAVLLAPLADEIPTASLSGAIRVMPS